MSSLRRIAFAIVTSVTLALAAEGEANAQYRNFTFGFEGGYMYLAADTGLRTNNFTLGMFGSWKGSDKWWFSGRAALSFPGESGPRGTTLPNTVILLLSIVPAVAWFFFYG